jgi:large repetitive protein
VSPSGVVLDSIEIGPVTPGIEPHRPDVAFDGTNHLVVWQQGIVSASFQYNVFARRISPAGTAVGEAFPVTSQAGSEVSPAVGFDGTNFLVVWNADPVSSTGRVRGARVTPGAVVLDAGGFDISADRGSAPTVTFDGTSHFVAWATPTGPVNDDDPLLGRRVSPDGSLVDPVVLSLGQGLHPSLGAGEGMTLLTFESNELIGFLRPAEIRATRLSGAAPLDNPPFIVTNPANDQQSPSIAFDGTGHLVAWVDQRPGFDYDIYAGRIGPNGTRLDGSGIAIATAPGHQLEPSVAFDGTNHLVVWQHLPTETADDYRSDIFGARVTRAGEVLDPAGIPIATTTDHEDRPVVAFDGTNYLVAWHESTGGIHATRVSTAGTVLDSTALTISSGGWNAAVTYGGGSYLVVWKNGSESRIIASRVGTDGSVLDPAGVTISPSAHGLAEPAIAFDGTNYLVAWDDNRNDPWGDIFAARVSPAGTVLDPSGIAVAANSPPTGPAQREPSVAANGSFLVAWRDDRRLGVTAGGADIFAAQVNSDGAVLDPSGISLTDSATYDSQPAVAPGAGDTWRVLYRRFAVEPQYGADRVFHRTVSPG